MSEDRAVNCAGCTLCCRGDMIMLHPECGDDPSQFETVRARNPIIWVVSKDEARVERYLVEAAASAGSVARTWDVAQGPREINGETVPFGDAVAVLNLACSGKLASADAGGGFSGTGYANAMSARPAPDAG